MESREDQHKEPSAKEEMGKLSSDRVSDEGVNKNTMKFSYETIIAAKELKAAFYEFMDCLITDMEENWEEDIEE